MKGDFSRRTFRQTKHYNSVLTQQGRTVSDADLNEQVAIQSHIRNTTHNDIIGACGVPRDGGGFEIKSMAGYLDLEITPGRIYVDGVLCELEGEWISCVITELDRDNLSATLSVESLVVDARHLEVNQYLALQSRHDGINLNVIVHITGVDEGSILQCRFLESDAEILEEIYDNPALLFLRRVTTYLTQEDYVNPDFAVFSSFLAGDDLYFLAYLCVSNLHRTANDDSDLREVALGGSDTATRSKTLWQVRLLPLPQYDSTSDLTCDVELEAWNRLIAESTAKLRAWVDPDATIDKPCLLPPGAGYTGLENQLYRVEIHDVEEGGFASFKWSRENGSVVTTIIDDISGSEISVRDLGRDNNLGFSTGVWVEIYDDSHILNRQPGVMTQIEVDPDRNLITVSSDTDLSEIDISNNAQVRRWESGPLSIDYDIPYELERGVNVQFSTGTHKVGDYWLIPARTATADIEWPRDRYGESVPQKPTGISTSYCRLAAISWRSNNGVRIVDCRRFFDPLIDHAPAASGALVVTGIGLKHKEDTSTSILPGDNLNDTEVSVYEFLNSTLIAVVSDPIVENTVNRVTCSLTLELPNLSTLEVTSRAGATPVIIYTHHIINADIRLHNNTEIHWAPVLDGLGEFLEDILKLSEAMDRFQRLSRLLVRFKLQGKYINSQTTPTLHLNGGVQGAYEGDRFKLNLPSGQGVMDHEFDAWFWLVPDFPIINVSPLSVAFNETTSYNIVVRNDGNAILQLTNISVVGSGSGQFAFEMSTNHQIAPGGNETIEVSFTRETSGSEIVSANLEIESNDPKQSKVVVNLSGENSVFQ